MRCECPGLINLNLHSEERRLAYIDLFDFRSHVKDTAPPLRGNLAMAHECTLRLIAAVKNIVVLRKRWVYAVGFARERTIRMLRQ